MLIPPKVMTKSIITMGKRKKRLLANTNCIMMVVNDVYAVPTEQDGVRCTGAGTGS